MIKVTVSPGAKQEKVVQVGEDEYKVWVKEPPEKGRANQRLCTVLANYLDIPKRTIKLVAGQSRKQKLIEIIDE